jgi:hypothetical protein
MVIVSVTEKLATDSIRKSINKSVVSNSPSVHVVVWWNMTYNECKLILIL